MGTKTNPYRFYKDATIYVQTSRHEGFGITIAEAKVFKLPIVSTDVAGAREQLKEKNEIVNKTSSMYRDYPPTQHLSSASRDM